MPDCGSPVEAVYGRDDDTNAILKTLSPRKEKVIRPE
jgi:hypothetical protein